MFIFDGHCDSILISLDQGRTLNDHSPSRHFDFIKGKNNISLQQMALFIEEEFMAGQALERVYYLLEQLKAAVSANPGTKLITSKSTLLALSPEQLGVVVAIEGAGHGLTEDFRLIDGVFEQGVRSLSLTWNFDTPFATGCFTETPNQGLSSLGIEAVKYLNKKGIILDVSHLSTRSFWDCVNTVSQPFIASHSCAKGVCDHPRNLDDKQIKAVANCDGVIGINFCPPFLKENATEHDNATLADIIRHLSYMKKLVGSSYLGLGSDFDGIDFTPQGLEDVTRLKDIPPALRKAGFSFDEIDQVMGENFRRLYLEVLPNE